jgi:hypothetical protein
LTLISSRERLCGESRKSQKSETGRDGDYMSGGPSDIAHCDWATLRRRATRSPRLPERGERRLRKRKKSRGSYFGLVIIGAAPLDRKCAPLLQLLLVAPLLHRCDETKHQQHLRSGKSGEEERKAVGDLKALRIAQTNPCLRLRNIREVEL